ncbi:MAG: DNA-3-methyladenine glycosylase I [Alphaproteobacteria bacterium]|nr:DNA-3-methyladenine glycosylase I [Alphaproteobacteria bacterium]
MKKFDDLLKIAAEKKGGVAEVEKLLPEVKTSAQVAAVPDDRILAEMTRGIFQSGFAWKVIEAKWDGFEKAFKGFVPGKVTAFSDEDLEKLVQNKEIVRNGAKIRATRDNAAFVAALAKEHGSAARFIADWPSDNIVGLWEVMKKRGNRLGGVTGPYVLRRIGKDTPVASQHVVAALVREGVVAKAVSSKRDQAKMQDAFNAWAAQSDRPLAHISRILAMTVD